MYSFSLVKIKKRRIGLLCYDFLSPVHCLNTVQLSVYMLKRNTLNIAITIQWWSIHTIQLLITLTFIKSNQIHSNGSRICHHLYEIMGHHAIYRRNIYIGKYFAYIWVDVLVHEAIMISWHGDDFCIIKPLFVKHISYRRTSSQRDGIFWASR